MHRFAVVIVLLMAALAFAAKADESPNQALWAAAKAGDARAAPCPIPPEGCLLGGIPFHVSLRDELVPLDVVLYLHVCTPN